MRLASGGDMKEISWTQYKMIEPFLMATFGGVLGAAVGGVVGLVIAPLTQIQYARVCARDLSATCAVYCGVESVMSGIRGKDDIVNHLAAAPGARRRILDHIKRYHKVVTRK